jgi:dTDP-4-dehydrorhamnose reductase
LKILLLGSNGQVGWELQRSLAPLGELIALDRRGQNGLSGDLSQPNEIAATVRNLAPDFVVNAAAYTQVDKAESEPEQARIINSQAVEQIAREVKNNESWLVHYSTDYVFDGSKITPWKESDTPSPINVYGQTKLEGEEAIRQSGCRHLILRTSWVYAARSHNFIHTMLRLAREKESLKVINDQTGAPTGAELIADVTAHAIRYAENEANLSGTYHLSASGETSWWNYARLVINTAASSGKQLRVSLDGIEPVSSEDFPTAAARPRNSRLDISKLQNTFNLNLPSWEHGVLRAVRELVQK